MIILKSVFFTAITLLVLIIGLASTPVIVTMATIFFGLFMLAGLIFLIYAIIHDSLVERNANREP